MTHQLLHSPLPPSRINSLLVSDSVLASRDDELLPNGDLIAAQYPGVALIVGLPLEREERVRQIRAFQLLMLSMMTWTHQQ